MTAPDGYEKWLRENTINYRGYKIGPGSISKNGEALMLWHTRLDEPKETSWEQGKKIVDEMIAKETADAQG